MVDKNPLDDGLHWYKDAIIYELHIKAFKDGDGDGIGDFQGLLEKLEYLDELGVTAIWLLPFYPSPLRDDGYDIADYYRINPSYGEIKQLRRFLHEAHKRNLKVITELVINHTSDQHPWFQRARMAPKGSPERNYYVWTDNPDQYKGVRIIFQDYEASNWTWDPVAEQYYWHRFFHHQPDLNYDSPLVQQEIFKIIDYWCRIGVDGFRLDAVPYLFEREGTNCENLPETHAFLKKLRKYVDDNFPGTLYLAEANMWPEDSVSYFGDGDECQMNYHFPVMPRMFMALQMEDRYPITDIFDQTPEIPETCQWAIFLRNHDELTLEMVTDEERDYMYKTYAKDPKAKINLGIRHRLSPLVENNRKKIELLNCLLFSLRGTPVIYYGDEIGMGDNVYLGDRDGVRTPMQWSPDRNAGFSVTNPQRLYLPVILDPEYYYESVNVETQQRNTSSLLWFMKRMISMRKRFKAFGRGDMKFINIENPKVLAFTRNYDNESVLVVANLSRFTQAAELELAEYKGYTPVEMFSKNRFPAIREDSPYFFTMSPHAFYWFILEKEHVEIEQKETLPLIRITKWKDIVLDDTLELLCDNIFPGYLHKTTWFRGKKRIMQNIRVAGHIFLPYSGGSACMVMLVILYESGLPAIYQLPLACINEAAANKIMETSPLAVIARLTIGEEESYLCDAFFVPELQQALIIRMGLGQDISLKAGELDFYGNRDLRKHVKQDREGKSKANNSESHTYITYDNCYSLKIYRKVDSSVNPDVEMTRFLSEEKKFPNVPAFAGLIEWREKRGSVVCAMMQVLCESHGDGFSFMLERLTNFYERFLSHEKESLSSFDLVGSLSDPAGFEDLSEELKELLGGPVEERSTLLGVRTGEMHRALADSKNSKDFIPEEFSLHYQRSLFSGLTSLVRSTFQGQGKNIKRLPEELQNEVADILSRKEEVLRRLRGIYRKKLDVFKIRIHGNYHLGQILFTGKDLMILDFGGDPTRTYSERRLKRSPIRDVACMIHSFYYAAYEGLFFNPQIRKEDMLKLLPLAELWAHYVSGFFLNAYLETVEGSICMPNNKDDLKVLLTTYLLEKAIYDLNNEFYNRPEFVIVPLKRIEALLK